MNKENKILMQAIEYIESMTRNPREYEPSVYTINHIAREALKEMRELRKSEELNQNKNFYLLNSFYYGCGEPLNKEELEILKDFLTRGIWQVNKQLELLSFIKDKRYFEIREELCKAAELE